MKHLLVIPGRLDNLNDYISAERTNKYRGAAMKQDNEQVVILSIKRCLKGIHIATPVIMRYRWFEKDRRRDKDNVSSFGRKVIQDALVKTNVLKNDGWAEIDCFCDWFGVDKANPRVEVEIEEVDDWRKDITG